jgi:Reverse transcriptase (RNA-dependent DNA polymerase)
MSVCAVPKTWKTAIITPVFKQGAAGLVSNNRPISLTSVPSKILERIISHKIVEHLNVNNILDPAQHGFCTGRSTRTNLLKCVNDWTLCLQSGHGTTVIYIDFSKATDAVLHCKLFARLQSYGVNGNLLQWLHNFFSGCTHKTKVCSSLSDKADLVSDIVQGSHIYYIHL